jgi:hypothetical protein
MIKQVHSGWGINVINNHNSYPYISPGSNGAGMVRWNSNSNCFEVNDGAVWMKLQMSDPTIELSPNSQAAIEWAQAQMFKERMREERIKNNPALQKAYDAIKRAEANYDILDKIIGEDNSVQHHPV